MSLLQAETLAAAVVNDWRIVFFGEDSSSEPFRRAISELGLTLTLLG